MRIDKTALLAEANAVDVARYIGMRVEKKGANYFTLCPGHRKRLGREDTNIGNCVLYENGYRCMACDPDKTHDVFDMVQEFTGCTFPEALQIVAEIYGGGELFASASGYVEKLDLTPEDLALIGLKNSGKIISPQNASFQHFEPEEGTSIEKVDEEFLSVKTTPVSLLKLKKDHPKWYRHLVATKAKEAGKAYCDAIKKYGSRNAPGGDKVFDLFEENGGIDDSVFVGIKNALLQKAWRCREIYDNHKEN